MNERDLQDLDECRTCGAAVASMSRHRTWHAKNDRDLKSAVEEAQQAKRRAGGF